MGKKRYNSLRKRRRCNSSMEDLPEDILIQIISSLEMRDAVRTSILSRRWRHLWKYTSNLSLSYFEITPPKVCFSLFNNKPLDDEERAIIKKLTHTIDHILASHHGTVVEDMKIMVPIAGPGEYAPLDRWISFASAYRVKYFSFSLYGFTPLTLGYYFPCHLFPSERGSPHLHKLDLYHCSLRADQNFDGFKNLTKLCLFLVGVTKGTMQILLSKCLSLKVLKISCPQLDVIEIPSSLCNLKKLNISTYPNHKKLESHSPSVSKLIYSSSIMRNSLVFKDALFLQEAEVDLICSWRHAFDQLPHDLPYLKTLHLAANWNAKVSSSPEKYAIFAHLKHLVLEDVPRDANIYATFISKAAPLLEKMVVHVCNNTNPMRVGNAHPSKRSSRSHDFPHYHLKVVEMTGFAGSRGQVELLKFLLRNATQLEVMSIDICSALSPQQVEIARAMFDKHLRRRAPEIVSLTFTQTI